ncbi:MAG TPA: sodium:solute symporter family protein, partial [Candidatus Baltobacteraceae bacterium]|nr:sodium:solute symporter family protein [Candidatus Baltobacteraceae bacterium]
MIHLHALDYAILAAYVAAVIAVGAIARRRVRSSRDFFESGRSLPVWICALAFISANLGAQEVMGMAANGAKYGLLTVHFYWLGAIPAMLFIGVFMMPFYYGSKARSVPEYLRLRFDEKTRTLNALTFAFMTVLSSGISMFALATLLQSVLGWNFNLSIAASGIVILLYIYAGGLRSAIYNEVLQFFLIVVGFAPLAFMALRSVGGWHGLNVDLHAYATSQGYPATAWTSLWRNLGTPAGNPMGVDWIGMVMGLGFVLSFGYWCTDFLVVQRAMAARNLEAARRTPLMATIPKMLVPAIVILPGMIAIALVASGKLHLPGDGHGGYDYNMVVPAMLAQYYGSGLLGLGLVALLASFMSGMAGNVTAFNTVFTYDIYQAHIVRDAPDAHYLRVGRLITIAGLLLSAAAAYAALSFNNIMDMLQLVFGFVNAPLFATFLLGMFWKRTTSNGAFYGLLTGTLAAVVFHSLTVPKGAVSGINGGWIAHLHT